MLNDRYSSNVSLKCKGLLNCTEEKGAYYCQENQSYLRSYLQNKVKYIPGTEKKDFTDKYNRNSEIRRINLSQFNNRNSAFSSRQNSLGGDGKNSKRLLQNQFYQERMSQLAGKIDNSSFISDINHEDSPIKKLLSKNVTFLLCLAD